MKRNILFFAITICISILIYPNQTIGLSSGSPGGKTASPMDNSDCTSCHNVNSTSVTITNITSNIPSSGYIPGTIYTITASLSSPLLTLNGFEITCEEDNNNTKTGTFFITDPVNTKFVNNGDAITHTPNGNSLSSWSFDWEAPSSGTGDVTFYGAFIEAGYPLGSNIGDYLTLSTLSISEYQLSPCNLAGGNVYIDYNTSPWMMNASVNGMSMYDYSWTDTNGVIVATANQTQFYTQWCVTITDIITGCDTVICQDCIANTSSLCMCPMIYMPVCGCDGVMYANYCIADCADVSWTPAISNGMPGGFLPCTQCDVEINGDSIICNLGSPQVLEAFPVGNGTAPYTYSWSNGQSNSSILTITAPGAYCVTLTDANGCTATECINVSVQDIPIYSNPSPPVICLGDSIALEFANTPLTDIFWVPTGDTIDMIYDDPITSTLYIVEGIDLNGCDRRGEIFVTVDSCIACVVEINNGTLDVEVCDGDTALLEATSGFDTYSWALNGSTGSLLGTTHIIHATNPGIYTVVVTDSTNCVDIDSIEVVMYPLVPLNPMTLPNPPIVCLGDSVVIEVNSGFLNYWWNTGNPLDQDEDRVVVFPAQQFTFVVEALDSNGCISREEVEVFIDTCTTSFAEINKNNIQIYPNPASEEFFINLNSIGVYNIEILDIIGRVLVRKENMSNLVAIKTTEFKEGTYFIKIQANSDIQIYKIVIDK